MSEAIEFVTGAGAAALNMPSMAYFLVRPTGDVPPNYHHGQSSYWRWKYDNHDYFIEQRPDGSVEKKAFPELVARHAYEYFLIRPKGADGGDVLHGVEIEEVETQGLEGRQLEVLMYACPFGDCQANFKERDELKAHILGAHTDLTTHAVIEDEEEEPTESRDLALSEIIARERGEEPAPAPVTQIKTKEDRQKQMAYARSQKGKRK